MFDAFILVQAEPRAAARVIEQVLAIDCVIEAEIVTRPYDVIARVRVADLHDLDVLISARMKTMDGVLRVVASTVVPEQKALD